jgi:dTDP-4-amino-4,6-dideoxygalactose transaminase
LTKTLALNGGKPIRTKPYPIWPDFDQSDEQAIMDVLRSGKWGRHQGTCTDVFETAFAAYQGANFGVAVMNGSVALRIALLAAGIQEGDEVIVPAYSFIATASAVIESNAIPVFCDIDRDTYCLSPASVEQVITEHTRAIIPVHFAGQAAQMDAIIQIAAKHNLVVIEDAAHAHGAEFKGKRLGSIGDFGCFSFQASKNLTAGEGGIILTNEDRYERICRALHTCGRYPEREWYEHYLPGGNYRMTEFQAALLLNQLSRLEKQTERRNRNGLYLNERLSETPGIRPLKRGWDETRHAYHLYIFRYNAADFDGLPRVRFLSALEAEGVPNLAGYGLPLYKQQLFLNRSFGPYTGYRSTHPDLDYVTVSCPISERACYEEACWLPQHVLLGSNEDMEDIVQAIEKIYQHRRELMS